MIRYISGAAGKVSSGLRQSETVTIQGRSRERYRRIAISSITSIAASGLGFIAKLAVVPLTLTYLGAERYGLLLTIASLAAWLAAADFGLSYGLRNEVARLQGSNDPRSPQQLSRALPLPRWA